MLTQEDSAKLRTLLAATVKLSEPLMFASRRMDAHIAFRRQLGMYIACTALNLNQTEVGRLFGRDRATVRFALRLVEDMRDHKIYDDMIEALGRELVTQSEIQIRGAGKPTPQRPLRRL